jgi:hypothetical protein
MKIYFYSGNYKCAIQNTVLLHELHLILYIFIRHRPKGQIPEKGEDMWINEWISVGKELARNATYPPLRPEEQFPGVSSLPASVRRMRFPFYSVRRIDGWLSRSEEGALYALGYWMSEPILEIGPWVGRSTICIARGVKNSGRKKRFVTCELNPTPANFRPYGTEVGFFVPADNLVPMGLSSRKGYEEEIKPIISSPGGVIGALERNLKRAGVRKMVEIHEGHFRNAPAVGYNFVFSDAMHTVNEVRQNGRDILPMLARGAVIAFHDTTPENAAAIESIFPLEDRCLIDSLFVGKLQG